jgi:hypothetical protein
MCLLGDALLEASRVRANTVEWRDLLCRLNEMANDEDK